MKTNTFYKPKNEFGHELASKVYVDNKDNALYNYVDQEIDETHKEHEAIRGEITDLSSKVDSNKTELENRRTIRTEEVPDGFNSVVSYIKSKWQNTSINERTQLHTELGQTIYLLSAVDDATTYEEYVCKNPDCVVTEVEPDVKMVRLGAVDSIYAKVDAYGSVRLIEDLSTDTAIKETTEWDDINEKRIAKTGYAVAPAALLSYWQKDKNLQEQIDSNKEEIINRIKGIEGELQGTGENGQITGSRIDYLYDVIGVNECCPNCDNESCTCDDNCAKLDCSIFCKIRDLDERLQENTESDVILQSRLDDTEGRIEYNANLISDCSNAIGTGRDTRTDNTIRGRLLDLTLIDGENKKELTDLVDTVRESVEGLKVDIADERNARNTEYIIINNKISDVSDKLDKETEERKTAITDINSKIDAHATALATLAYYPRILTISTEINSQNGGVVEIPYSVLINKIYTAAELQIINRGNIEAIVNSAKLTDDGNTIYEQAHPEITYIGEYSPNGPADNRKVRVVFADADSVAHNVVISITLYTDNSQTSMLYF